MNDAAPWLIRVPEVFAAFAPEITRRITLTEGKALGREYWLLPAATESAVSAAEVALFVPWRLRVEHSWPCCPQKMEGFVEKGAQALWKKFGPRAPQTLLIGQLHSGTPNPYYKKLASNLRGRALQLFPALPSAAADVETQQPGRETLFCLLGPEGLFAGMMTPRAAGGFYAGGTKFIKHDAADTISRAGAKVAEALHYLLLHRPAPRPGRHWLELGASPGGMTSELLARGQRVTGVDRAPLDARLAGKTGLTFVREDVGRFRPPPGVSYDALLCDLNGNARDAISHVTRLAPALRAGAPVIFTLKTLGMETPAAMLSLRDAVVATATTGGLRLVAQTHLTANRQEFTLFFEKGQAG